MEGYHAIRELKTNSVFKKGDVLVLFGELFSRGYATGLVEEAERRGMKIIRTTVGRRDKDHQLRPLNQEELAQQPQPLINIPLEVGFDFEIDDQGKSPVDYTKEVKLSDWESFRFPAGSLETSLQKGQQRFKKYLSEYVREVEKQIPTGANVCFAHLMAGGIPRTKIIMPLMNRALRGTGDKFLSSRTLWQSDLGRLCQMSFNEVTANTFSYLIEATTELRQKLEKGGSKVSYTAYGYHGTEVLIKNQFQWQSYTPYLQGFAKKLLEDHSRRWSQSGVTCAVYNCPEILTNSSAVFNGVELSLYPLLSAFTSIGKENSKSQLFMKDCQALLKGSEKISDMLQFIDDYLSSKLIRDFCRYDEWPQHNSKDQLEKMLGASEHLMSLHQDSKNLITGYLSEKVFESCGQVMLTDSAQPESPVSWINHDIIAKLHVT